VIRGTFQQCMEGGLRENEEYLKRNLVKSRSESRNKGTHFVQRRRSISHITVDFRKGSRLSSHNGVEKKNML
jgi:hypothetical protein